MIGEARLTLQSPWRLSTHYQLKARRTWTRTVGRHEVEVIKDRARLFGGLRANTFTVSVDGQVVATATDP